MDLLVEFMSMKIKDQTQITNNYIWTSLVYLFKSLLFKKKPSLISRVFYINFKI